MAIQEQIILTVLQKGIVTFILLDMMMVLNVLAKLIGDGAGVMDYNPYVIHAIYRCGEYGGRKKRKSTVSPRSV